MINMKQFDLNKVPESSSSSEVSNGQGEATTRHEEEEEVIMKTNLIKPEKEGPFAVPSTCLVILKDLKRRWKDCNSRKTNLPSDDKAYAKVCARNTSAIEIVQFAKQLFLQRFSKKVNGLSLVGLSDEEAREAELVKTLLISAEKAGQQQFERASQLLKQCAILSSKTGTPVQRLAHYFALALQDKINKEAGESTSICDSSETWNIVDLREALLSVDSSFISYYLKSPLAQVSSFTTVQIISEHVKAARKVHVIGFQVHIGILFMLLIQDLATRSGPSLEHLKITAVVTRFQSNMENKGRQLTSFAQSLNLSFTFKVVTIEDLPDLSIDLFDFDDEEQVAVYFPTVLSMVISQPSRLDSLMTVIRDINPCITVVTEVEANHSSPTFIDRFLDSLVYSSATFDSVADCMADDELNRINVESLCFDLWVRNVLVGEGEGRVIRHQGIDVWRKLFAQFGMKEIEVSIASQDQANILIRTAKHGCSCTLEMNGKCLIVGWKGVPTLAVSAWKFH